MEILTRDEFWAKNPAPGTKFIEVEDNVCEISANSIEPDVDDPDEITMIRVSRSKTPTPVDSVLVFSWGSWEGHEELLTQHDAAVTSVELAGYKHECVLGIPKKKAVKKTTGPKPKDPRK